MSLPEKIQSQDCWRIYNQMGEHVLSLVLCDSSNETKQWIDVCTPEGKVVFCDLPYIPGSGDGWSGLLNVLMEHLTKSTASEMKRQL